MKPDNDRTRQLNQDLFGKSERLIGALDSVLDLTEAIIEQLKLNGMPELARLYEPALISVKEKKNRLGDISNRLREKIAYPEEDHGKSTDSSVTIKIY